MKKTSKKVISVILSVLMLMACLPTMAFAETSGYYSYYLDDNQNVLITDVDTSISGDVTIPSTIDGHPVATIGNESFAHCDLLTSVTIPDSVTEIWEYAFYRCASLKSVSIGKGVTAILSSVFFRCPLMTSIDVDENNNNFSSQDGVLFDKTMTEIVRYPEGKSETSYIIPDSVTSIRNDSFKLCTLLTNITIPDSVTSIGGWAFSNCTSLTNITIPDSVTSIGDQTFEECTSLTSVTIGNGLTSIETDVFYNCSSLTNVTIGNGVEEIGQYAFEDCSSLTSITLPSNVTYIDFGAFCGCTSLTNIILTDSITTIGWYVFDACDNLSDVYYTGTEEQWNNIIMERTALSDSATIHFNYVPHTEHTWSDWTVTVPATCTAKGTETRVCTVCNETETREIPITAHSYGEWTVTTPATCTTEGQKQKVCSNCGDAITETIDAVGHIDNDNNGYCDVCNEAMNSESETDLYDNFRCKMCAKYEELKNIPVVGHIATVIHFFVHLIEYISSLT